MHVEAWLARAARTRPDARALGALTYSELHDRAARAATALDARGAAPGERVAIALAPGEDFAVALHACLLLGAAAVPVDLRSPERPTAGAAVVVDEPLALTAEPIDGGIVHDLDAPAIVVHTSGTTADPVPVELTFGNWLWSALGSAVALGTQPGDRWLCTLPLVHVGGLSILVRSAIYATTAIVHEGWDTERVLGEIAAGATLVSVVPTTLRRLLDAGLRDPPALRCALLGGAPCPPDLPAAAAEAGVVVAQTYGLTEACSQVTAAAPGDLEADAGPPLFCTRVSIDEATGEILVASPTVAPAAGPLLSTGDLGSLDGDGRLTVVGRLSDTIVSGGENVAPATVEAVLLEHPAVEDVLVYGRHDERWGEAVLATVVLADEADEESLRAYCAQRLAPHQVPKQIEFATEIPRTASGKPLRPRATP